MNELQPDALENPEAFIQYLEVKLRLHPQETSLADVFNLSRAFLKIRLGDQWQERDIELPTPLGFIVIGPYDDSANLTDLIWIEIPKSSDNIIDYEIHHTTDGNYSIYQEDHSTGRIKPIELTPEEMAEIAKELFEAFRSSTSKEEMENI